MISMHNCQCCAVKELNGLTAHGNAPEAVVQGIYLTITVQDKFGPRRFRCRYMLFTEARRHGYGESLKNYIEAHHLGTVTVVGPHVNPNTANQVIVFIWVMDFDRLRDWWAEHPTTMEALIEAGILAPPEVATAAPAGMPAQAVAANLNQCPPAPRPRA